MGFLMPSSWASCWAAFLRKGSMWLTPGQRLAAGPVDVEPRGAGERLQVAAQPQLAVASVERTQHPALQAPELELVARDVVEVRVWRGELLGLLLEVVDPRADQVVVLGQLRRPDHPQEQH